MAEIKCTFYVPRADGGYVNYDTMTHEAKREFSRKIVERIGAEINKYYTSHGDAIGADLARVVGL